MERTVEDPLQRRGGAQLLDYEELAELIAELDMAGPMKALLAPYGEKAEALLQLLP